MRFKKKKNIKKQSMKFGGHKFQKQTFIVDHGERGVVPKVKCFHQHGNGKIKLR